MRIIKPYANIMNLSPVLNPLQLIEQIGRTCYKSHDRMGKGSDLRFVKMIMEKGHLSVIEHVSASVLFVCDRGVTHELVRHRIASYSQESTRYCNYSGTITFVKPCFCPNVPVGEFNKINDVIRAAKNPLTNVEKLWLNSVAYSGKTYTEMIGLGWKPQEARSVLPNSLKTEIVATLNLRSWLNFFEQRCAPTAHPQMRELAVPLLYKMSKRIPVIFDELLKKYNGG